MQSIVARLVTVTALFTFLIPTAAAQTIGTTFLDNTSKLKYTITSTSPATVKITDNKTVSINNLSIPASVTYQGTSYVVTEIEDHAFDSNQKLTGSLEIPASVITIGENAFASCRGLTGPLTLHEGLITIKDAAFTQCTNLSGALVIPNTVTAIPFAAFYGTKFSTLTIGDHVETIGENAFYHCAALVGDLLIPESVTAIGKSAFNSCTNLNGRLQLPSRLTTIKDGTFSGCQNIKGPLNIPSGVSTIGSTAFSSCKSLTGKLIIPSGVTTINPSTFRGCQSLTGDLIIPDNVTAIGQSAFSGCSGLNGTLHLPAMLEIIPDNAFSDCKSMKGPLVIPSGVTTIGTSAFENCQSLIGDVHIAAATSLGDKSFANCTSLTGFSFENRTTPLLASNTNPQGIIWQGCTSLEYIDMSDITYFEDIIPTFQDYTNWENITNLPYTFSRNASNDYDIAESIFHQISDHTVVYLPKGFPADKIRTEDDYNVVVDGRCNRFILMDGYDYELPHAFTAKSTEYRKTSLTDYRDFGFESNPNNAASVFLPYSFTTPKGLKAYKLSVRISQTDQDYTEYFIFTPVNDATQPCTPYLLLPDKGVTKAFTSADLLAVDGQISATNTVKGTDGHIAPMGTTVNQYSFFGTTETLSHNESIGFQSLNIDQAGHDVFRLVNENPKAYVGRFRGAIKNNGNAQPAKAIYGLLFEESNTPTAIEGIKQAGQLTGQERIYSIDGRYLGTDLQQLPSGIYIIKGKKISK